jgi:GTPase SAR1 family protein
MKFGKQLKDELTNINIYLICHLIEINAHDQITQILKQIEKILDYLDENEDEIIEKELEEKYKEELVNFNNCFDTVRKSKCFDKMKMQRDNQFESPNNFSLRLNWNKFSIDRRFRLILISVIIEIAQ